ncbi:amino acid permease/ SLC12A domain-containing protein [Usnea florida]
MSNGNILERVGHDVFRNDRLDRKLKRRHITGKSSDKYCMKSADQLGIAFSGAVGIGLFSTSGQTIALGGPVGALLAFFFAGLVMVSVMRSLAEMVSVRPVKGAIMDYPGVFVDEALGFAVGLLYWCANCMSVVTLTVAAAMFTQYWSPNFGVAPATFLLLVLILFMNACGVRLYGNLEWGFKWVKILLIILVCVTMVAIKAGAGSKPIESGRYELSEGYSPTGFFRSPVSNVTVSTLPTGQSDVPIKGTGGQVLAVWASLSTAIFQFMGGEMVLATAAEAESPRRDLPVAARYMYLLPVSLYLIGILFVGLCIDYLNPLLPHMHILLRSTGDPRLFGIITAAESPYVIVIQEAGISALPSFLNAAFIFSAITAANSALYVSSRTLFLLASKSDSKTIRNTIGRTNNGHTPLAAIIVSFLPGLLAFLVVRASTPAFQEPISALGRLYTGPLLCVYASECIAFIRFQQGMKLFPNTIDRNGDVYPRSHYRAHWQPLWAILGLVLCTLLAVTRGWTSIYDLCVASPGVSKEDSIVDLIADYLGPCVFLGVYLAYKLKYKTKIRSYQSFKDKWYPDDVPDESDIRNEGWEGRGGIRGFLSWIR